MPDMSMILQVYKKFLIGSEKCEKLEVNYLQQLQVVAQVALFYPESLQQLRQVENGPYHLRSLQFTEERTEKYNICKINHKVKISMELSILLIACKFYFSVLIWTGDLLL